MQKIWRVRQEDRDLKEMLAQALGISPLTCQLLINRGLNSPRKVHEFLRCDLRSLADPFLLKDMALAVDRINRAISSGELIMVYADYDVDGITGCALLIKALTELGAKPIYYIPDRLKEGYGLNKAGIDYAHRKNASLIITVDCGISAYHQINYASKLGIDLVVIDHHQLVGSLPPAFAIIDPKRNDEIYPYKDLAGVGLAFKLVQALTGEPRWEDLDLVALGTVADIVPMMGENRILTKHGLSQLTNTRSVGLKALMDVASLSGRSITTQDVSYILGPRINAAGRLGEADTALKLLLATSKEEAASLAQSLDEANRERQRIESQTLEEALAKVAREINFKVHKAIVLWDENWHSGVIGIVASKVAERYYRPTIIISIKEGKGRGSGRSIENFHLFDALERCEAHLEGYGGHRQAVGLTIDINKLTDFRNTINLVASEILQPQDLISKINIDSEIPLSNLSAELIEEMESLGPFGPENPRPIFSSRNLTLKGKPEAIGRESLRMWVTDQRITCEAIWRNIEAPFSQGLEGSLHLAYSPSVYNWQGEPLIRLNLEDARLER